MEKLRCKTCGSESLAPMQVMLEEEDQRASLLGEEQESQFYTCHVCGDNWLSVKEARGEDCTVTFIHQMGMSPVLRRVAHMQTPVLVNPDTVEEWEYYFDEEAVSEDDWRSKLQSRRDTLRSICMN